MEGGQYVIDASVIVKWLHEGQEDHVEQAQDILETAEGASIVLFISDITAHEVLNAIICGKRLRDRDLEQAVDDFFQLPVVSVETNSHRAAIAASMAAKYGITFYDAIYCALAFERGIPLITANPKHQKAVMNIQVIALDKWPME